MSQSVPEAGKKVPEAGNKVPQQKVGVARLFEIAGAKKGLVVVSCILSVLSTLASFFPYVCIYYIMKELLEHAADLSSADGGLLIRYGWMAFLSMAASFALMFVSIVCSHVAAFRILYLLKIAFAKHVATLPLGFHTSHSTGKLRKVMDDNIEKIEGFIAHQLPDLAGSIAAPVVMLGMMLYFDWRMGLVCLLPLVISYIIQAVAFSGSKSKEFLGLYQDYLEDMNNSAVEYVRGMAVVKTFNQTVFSFRRFHRSIVAYKDFALKYTMSMRNAFAAFVVLLNAIGVFLIPAAVLIGSRTADYQAFALSFLFYLVFGSAMSGPVMKLMYVSSSGRQIAGGVERMDRIFAEEPLPAAASPLSPSSYEVSFDRVSFTYMTDEGESDALREVSFTARQGQVTALVGPSGSGKSTAAHLVPRFWDVTSGAVRIGGIDVRDMEPEELMRLVGFVFQDVFLFKQSILDNIRAGNPRASLQEVMEAARAAQCHDFIERLPQGYDTVIGTKGVHLSGGEKQRLVIARAMLKNAPILILDEATAFADPENEHRIQLAFERLIRNKTVIVIAHRLSTIRGAGQILVLDEGAVAERGTHDELLARGGKYKRMWETYTGSLSWSIAGEGVEEHAGF